MIQAEDWLSGKKLSKLGLGTLEDSKVVMSQQRAPAGTRVSSTLGCINRSTASGLREAIIPSVQHLLDCIRNSVRF